MNKKQQMKLNAEQQEMVVKNHRLVYYLVNKMGILQHEYDDIVSVGTIGLVKAVSTFVETKGIKFATYATRCITNEILMHYRTEKKHWAVISLETPINTDFEGNELLFADIVPDSEETFSEQIEAYDTFSNAISFVLNALAPKETMITLYLMAGFTQDEIGKKLVLSQSYISRLAKRSHLKIKKFLGNTEQFKEVFDVSMEENLYKISFSSTDVKNFNSIFSSLIRKWNPNKRLPSFKITCTSERIFIILPAIEESFAFIAEIVEEIDNYAMKTVSESSSGNIPEEAESEPTKTGKNIKSTDVISSGNIPEEAESEPTKTGKNIKSTDVISSGNIPEEAETEPTTAEKNTKSTAASNSGSIPGEAESSSVRKGGKMEIIRSYILSVEEFTVKELKEKFTFPNANSAIANAITNCKSKGLIVSAGYGKYDVKK